MRPPVAQCVRRRSVRSPSLGAPARPPSLGASAVARCVRRRLVRPPVRRRSVRPPSLGAPARRSVRPPSLGAPARRSGRPPVAVAVARCARPSLGAPARRRRLVHPPVAVDPRRQRPRGQSSPVPPCSLAVRSVRSPSLGALAVARCARRRSVSARRRPARSPSLGALVARCVRTVARCVRRRSSASAAARCNTAVARCVRRCSVRPLICSVLPRSSAPPSTKRRTAFPRATRTPRGCLDDGQETRTVKAVARVSKNSAHSPTRRSSTTTLQRLASTRTEFRSLARSHVGFSRSVPSPSLGAPARRLPLGALAARSRPPLANPRLCNPRRFSAPVANPRPSLGVPVAPLTVDPCRQRSPSPIRARRSVCSVAPLTVDSVASARRRSLGATARRRTRSPARQHRAHAHAAVSTTITRRIAARPDGDCSQHDNASHTCQSMPVSVAPRRSSDRRPTPSAPDLRRASAPAGSLSVDSGGLLFASPGVCSPRPGMSNSAPLTPRTQNRQNRQDRMTSPPTGYFPTFARFQQAGLPSLSRTA